LIYFELLFKTKIKIFSFLGTLPKLLHSKVKVKEIFLHFLHFRKRMKKKNPPLLLELHSIGTQENFQQKYQNIKSDTGCQRIPKKHELFWRIFIF